MTPLLNQLIHFKQIRNRTDTGRNRINDKKKAFK